MEQQQETKLVDAAQRIECAGLNVSGAYNITDPQGRKVIVGLEPTIQDKEPDFVV